MPAEDVADEQATAAKPEPGTPNAAGRAVPSDEQRAAALWTEIRAYKSWPAPPELGGLQPGESVHGDFVRYYMNPPAGANFDALPPGSILVKEGFRDEEGTLKAITAMKRIGGYDPDQGDWLFVRYDAGGKATRINRGCASCHEDAGGDDFSFAND